MSFKRGYKGDGFARKMQPLCRAGFSASHSGISGLGCSVCDTAKVNVNKLCWCSLHGGRQRGDVQ